MSPDADVIPLRGSPPCPSCGSPDVRRILWGFPAPEAFDAGERGEVELGGCMPEPQKWSCASCHARWPPLVQRPLEDLFDQPH